MEPAYSPVLFSLCLLLGMVLLFVLGRSIGLRRHLDKATGERESLGTIEGAVYGMFGLLMAFTFSGAAERFGAKRALIADEVAYTRTAYLRLQLVSADERATLEDLFRRYVDSRIASYRRLPDVQAFAKEATESRRIQKEIWSRAVQAARLSSADAHAGEVLLPAINDMINIAGTRELALQVHPPRIVFELLFALGLMCSLMAGYHMASGRKWNWLHVMSFAVITAIVVYVILDMEYPRGGLISLQNADQALIALRADMT